MFPAYEKYAENRIIIYEGNLKSVIAAKIPAPANYTKYGFNSMSDEVQFKKKMENINADLFPTNYSDVKTQKGIKEVATNWLFQAKEATENWKPVGITNVVVSIEDKTTEWKNILVNLSQILQKGETSAETKEFTYPPLEFPDVKQFFTKVEKPGLSSWLISLLLWALMLLSWFITKRSTKSTICKSKNKSEFDVEI